MSEEALALPLPEAAENPLRTYRLNHSSDFHPEWDVDSLNAGVSKTLLQEVARVVGRREPDPGQLIPVLLSPAGYGKTHLFGRLAYALRDKAFFVFVGAIPDARRPLEHIRWNTVEALFAARPGKPTLLAEALSELFHASFVESAKHFRGAEASVQKTLLGELQAGKDLVLKIAESGKDVRSFQRLAASTAAAMPHVRGSVVKALVLGWSPQASYLARRWLRGEGLSEDEAQLIGIDEESPAPLEVLNGIAAIFQYRKPMVICCDQLESILKDAEGPKQLTTQLMELLAGVPNQFLILSCLEDRWTDGIEQAGLDAFKQRTRKMELAYLSKQQAVELLKKRLSQWPQYKPELGELWPFDQASVEQYAEEKMPTPRVLIRRCAEALDRLANNELAPPIFLGEAASPAAVAARPISELFLKEWGRELQMIRQDPLRNPDHMQDARVYAALKELMTLGIMAAGALDPLRVKGFKESVLAPAGNKPRYGMQIDLKDQTGKPVSVVVAVTILNGGTTLFYFIRELDKALESANGAVLLHPRGTFSLGPVGRALVDKATDDKKLIIYGLENQRPTFEAMECAMSLLKQAQSGELVLGTTVVSYEQCQQLILDTQVIQALDLFKAIGNWSGPVAAPPVVAATPVKVVRKRR